MALNDQQYQAYADAIRGINNGQYGVRNGITGQVVGAYDIIPSTYNDLSRRYPSANLGTSDTRTPQQEDAAMRLLANEEAAALERNGLPVTPANLSVVHFFGVGGGPRVLQAPPGTPLSQVFGSDWNNIVAANPQIANWTVADAQGWGANLAGSPMAYAGTQPTTPAQNAAAGQAVGGTGLGQTNGRWHPGDGLRTWFQQKAAGGSPILENMRSRRQGQGQATPFLDAMIANNAQKASTDHPLFEWIRNIRQSAGYQTPLLDRVLGNNDVPAAPDPVAPYQPVTGNYRSPVPSPTPAGPNPGWGGDMWQTPQGNNANIRPTGASASDPMNDNYIAPMTPYVPSQATVNAALQVTPPMAPFPSPQTTPSVPYYIAPPAYGPQPTSSPYPTATVNMADPSVAMFARPQNYQTGGYF